MYDFLSELPLAVVVGVSLFAQLIKSFEHASLHWMMIICYTSTTIINLLIHWSCLLVYILYYQSSQQTCILALPHSFINPSIHPSSIHSSAFIYPSIKLTSQPSIHTVIYPSILHSVLPIISHSINQRISHLSLYPTILAYIHPSIHPSSHSSSS